MTEQGRELSELKHEVVEARNQAIKTDNQIKNLTFDIKGFEKRFDTLEGRVRLSSIGVNLIVALTIALSAYMVYALRVQVFEAEIKSLKEVVREEHLAAQAKSDALAAKVQNEDKQRAQSEEAAKMAQSILVLLDGRQDTQAADQLGKLELRHLSPLEQKMLQPRFNDLRRRQAETLYRQGRKSVADGRPEQAIAPLGRAIELDQEGRFVGQARYQLAWALWNSHRYAEVEPLAREMSKNADRGVMEEARYMLATALTRLDRTDEAKRLFNQLVAQESRYTGACRAYLAAMERNQELPIDLPNGRIRLPRRVPGVGPGGPAQPSAAETP
jgi:TolA-binding protein